MAQQDNLNTILSAVYGKDVRQAIHDGIAENYSQITTRYRLCFLNATGSASSAIGYSYFKPVPSETGDFVIDKNGYLWSITSIDTQGQTVTLGTKVVEACVDADNVHYQIQTSTVQTSNVDEALNALFSRYRLCFLNATGSASSAIGYSYFKPVPSETGDFVIDKNGYLWSITSIDTQGQTVTLGNGVIGGIAPIGYIAWADPDDTQYQNMDLQDLCMWSYAYNTGRYGTYKHYLNDQDYISEDLGAQMPQGAFEAGTTDWMFSIQSCLGSTSSNIKGFDIDLVCASDTQEYGLEISKVFKGFAILNTSTTPNTFSYAWKEV